MKKIILLFTVSILLTACSNKREDLELFSAESFAYSMDSGWELNATVRAKGFEQDESGDKFTAKLSYVADLETPDGKLFRKISSGNIDKTSAEKLIDLPIETQIKLDSTFKLGNYKITFFVKDELTGRKAYLWSFFELSK
ncbi:MAG: hypothetical protein NTX65_08175 [Ignavibacteriales bacterium]|nr:hypothetical protein [Ignavibacteriales bacterium]